MIVLHKSFKNPGLGHGLPVVTLEKKSPFVAEHARLQNKYSRQRRRNFLDRIHRGRNRGEIMRAHSFPKTLSPATFATNTPHSCCSSSTSRSSPPARP